MAEQGQVAGMPFREIAASAYRTYCIVAQACNDNTATMRPFDELPEYCQIGWEAAVRQALDCTRRTLGDKPPDEKRWAIWTPPK